MVIKAADKKATVYKVEFLGVCPLVFDVVDLECAIPWNTASIRISSHITLIHVLGRLNRAQVVAYNLC